MTIAVTDREVVLACVGELADDFPVGSSIHTPTTRYVIEHGIAQSFTSVMDVKGEMATRVTFPQASSPRSRFAARRWEHSSSTTVRPVT